ncbi:hypothetical protein FNF27_06962 [Cafeteria roenbergensis]|nr:hypothetical protein FNF31_06883 [Cafeteria roenbergensis]KAA0169414.1 hypothetical protein FNF27_06962 [Cafeteria roenbergensis]
MLANWGVFTRRHPATVKRRVRKGIPDSLRGIVWPVLAGGDELARRHPSMYRRLLMAAPREDDFAVIRNDLFRTFPRHEQFKEEGGPGQLALMRVLRAYAAYDTEVGYCQGMAFVAALLITYMPEEIAFWTLVAVLRRRGLRGHYLPQFPLYLEHVAVLMGLLAKHEPAIYRLFEAESIGFTMFGMQWLLTLFAHSFPFEFVVRVVDVVCLEGHKALLRVVVAVLRLLRQRLLDTPGHALLKALRTLPAKLNADEVMSKAMAISVTSEEVMKLRSAFRTSTEGRVARRECGRKVAARKAAAAARGRIAAEQAAEAGDEATAAAWRETATAFDRDAGLDDPEAVFWADSATSCLG